MNTFLTFVFLIGMILFLFHEYIRYNRFKGRLELSSIVNRMEQHFVVNNIHLNKNYIKLLRSFKNISTNPEMLDIEILLMSQILLINKGVKKEELKKESEEKENIINELGPDFKKMVEQFNKQSSSLIKLSIYKPDFLLFSAKLMMKYFFRKGVKSAHKLKSELKFAMKNDIAIYDKSNAIMPC